MNTNTAAPTHTAEEFEKIAVKVSAVSIAGNALLSVF